MLKKMLVGLTGGIASGKTHIAKDLAALGAAVIDADNLGHRAYEPGTPAFNAIVGEFGAEVLDTQAADVKVVNRQRLGAIVFADKARMKKLTDIVWPAIQDLALREVAELRAAGKQLIVLEAAVLIEAGWHSHVDEVWLATVPRDVAISRLQNRNNLSCEDAERRIDAQMSDEQRKPHAQVTIDTNRPREETTEIVKRLFDERLREAD